MRPSMARYTVIYMTSDGSQTGREDRDCRLSEVQRYVDECVDRGQHQRVEVFDQDGIRIYLRPRIMRRRISS